MTNAEFVKGLRELADFYEQHPNVELPWSATLTVFPDNENFREVARNIGSFIKQDHGNFLSLRKTFSGNVTLDFSTEREKVCRRVVKGTKIIPAVTYPERVEEIVEWECDSLLRPVGEAKSGTDMEGQR